MQDIRNSLRDASVLASKEDYEQAILLLEKTANDSKCQNYIGGVFCAYKHLGDVYYKMEQFDSAILSYQNASNVICDRYLSEPLIRDAATAVWMGLYTLTQSKPNWEQLNKSIKEKIDALKDNPPQNDDNEYDVTIGKQNRSFSEYDAFFAVCKKNKINLVSRYIHRGLDVNFVNPQSSYTALHQACWRGNKDIVFMLLQHGADPLIKNKYGETARDTASLLKHSEIVELIDRVVNEGTGWMAPCEKCSEKKCLVCNKRY